MTTLEAPVTTLTDRLPYSSLLEAPVATENGPVMAIELAERYFRSPYATYMDTDQPLRFADPFGYDRQHMIEDFGTDVLPVGHQRLTGEYTAWVLQRQYDLTGRFPVDESEIGLVVLGGFLHDSGETKHPEVLAHTGAVCGDIPYGKKTDGHRAIEVAVRKFVWSRTIPDVDPEVVRRMEAMVAHTENSRAHDTYETAHSLQTFNTGLLAGRSVLREMNFYHFGQPMTRNRFEIRQASALARAVVSSCLPSMIKYSAELQLGKELPLPPQPRVVAS